MENAWSWMLDTLKRGSGYKDMFGLLKCHGDAVAAEILDDNGNIQTRSYQTYVEMTEKAFSDRGTWSDSVVKRVWTGRCSSGAF